MPNNTLKRAPLQSSSPAPSVQRLADLFPCGDSYHTWFDPRTARRDEHGKVRPRYRDSYGPVTIEDWTAHVDGRLSLTLPPNLDDGTARWFCIDVDDYDLDHAKWAARIGSRGLPVVPVRSKGGGLHAFGFFKEAVPIDEVLAVASVVVRQLGLPSDTEIFPKRAVRNPTGVNMPYLGSTNGRTMERQVGIRQNGSEIGLPEFVRLCARMLITAEQRANLLQGAPPAPVPMRREPKRRIDRYLGPLPSQEVLSLMRQDAGRGTIPQAEIYEPDIDPGLKVECALEAIPADLPYVDDRDKPSWFRVVCALTDNFAKEDGLPILQDWCETSPLAKHRDHARNERAWDRIAARSNKTDFDLGTIYHYATLYESSLHDQPGETWQEKYRRLLTQKQERA